MRTVFLGSSSFAVEILKALHDSPHRPSLVIAPPDRPKGRGRKLAAPPAAEAARELDLALIQTPNVNGESELAEIASHEPEAIGVCEFGQLIREPLLSRYLILNVHPSLLPRWRGAAPIERALMEGDTETGVTIFQIGEGLDSGPIALHRAEQVLREDTRGTLSARLARLGGELLVEALDRADKGELELTEQTEEGATYAHKLQAEERRLDPTRPAAELERIVRALTPSVGAHLALPSGERLGVSAARAEAGSGQPGNAALSPGELRAVDGCLFLGTSQGVLELIEVQPPGKRPMAVADFLRGHALPARVDHS
jgi:methionyl-tRNA formyltransferase